MVTKPEAGEILRQSVVTGFAHPARNVALLGIEPGMKVADFGAGSGAYVLAIAGFLSGSGHIYAIDVQRDLLRRLKNESERRGYKNVEVLWSDLESGGGSKLADQSNDLVLISNLLFQINEKKIVIAEAWRVLREGGRLVIIDWSESFSRSEAAREGVGEREFPVKEGSGPPAGGTRWKTVGFQGGWGPPETDVVKKDKAISLATSAGFELFKEFPAGAHHYGLIFRKIRNEV
ncbi:MAG TPA: methyltransferase domain-containing protein [Candidatus Paceibacterota bacterium]